MRATERGQIGSLYFRNLWPHARVSRRTPGTEYSQGCVYKGKNTSSSNNGLKGCRRCDQESKFQKQNKLVNGKLAYCHSQENNRFTIMGDNDNCRGDSGSWTVCLWAVLVLIGNTWPLQQWEGRLFLLTGKETLGQEPWAVPDNKQGATKSLKLEDLESTISQVLKEWFWSNHIIPGASTHEGLPISWACLLQISGNWNKATGAQCMTLDKVQKAGFPPPTPCWHSSSLFCFFNLRISSSPPGSARMVGKPCLFSGRNTGLEHWALLVLKGNSVVRLTAREQR